MRTMICECLPNFAGDATVACVSGKILPKRYIRMLIEKKIRDKNMLEIAEKF